MLRRIVCCCLCLLLMTVTFAATAQETFVMAGFDGQDSSHDWNTNRFFARMQDRTGVSFTFEQYTDRAKWQAAKDAMFAEGGQLPDVLFKAAMNTSELIRYSDSGQLIDLKPLLEEHAPNLWALLQENPDWLSAITLPSGKIAALPTLQQTASQNAMWINRDWLDKLGLAMPTDLDSLHDVLVAFRDGDPNGNGKRDEIPLAFLGPWELKFLAHAFGVTANDYNLYLDEAGQVHYWPKEDSFWAQAELLREWYDEGLLHKDGFVTADTLRRITDDKAAVTYGMFFAPTPVSLVTYEMSRQYMLLEPLVYEGKQVYRDLFGQVTRGVFAITSACTDPGKLLEWVDILYSEEGAIEAMAGIEGEDYIVDAEGYWTWKGGIDALTASSLSEISVYDSGDMPWLFPEAFYDRYEEANVRRISEELKKLEPFIRKPFPTYTLTEAQRAQALQLQDALGAYVDETLAGIVLGLTPTDDAARQAFVDGLSERGMAQMIALWQEVALEAAR